VSSFESLATGKKLEVLSLKISQLQQEMAGLRQDVRTIMRLLQDMASSKSVVEHVDNDPQNS